MFITIDFLPCDGLSEQRLRGDSLAVMKAVSGEVAEREGEARCRPTGSYGAQRRHPITVASALMSRRLLLSIWEQRWDVQHSFPF